MHLFEEPFGFLLELVAVQLLMKGGSPLFVHLCDNRVPGDIFDMGFINQLKASFVVILNGALIYLDDGALNDSF